MVWKWGYQLEKYSDMLPFVQSKIKLLSNNRVVFHCTLKMASKGMSSRL